MSKKDLALKQALDQITTSFGKGSIMWLGRSVSPKEVPVISTGSFTLDLALGIGGFPKVSQHITEKYLDELIEFRLQYVFLSKHFPKAFSVLPYVVCGIYYIVMRD